MRLIWADEQDERDEGSTENFLCKRPLECPRLGTFREKIHSVDSQTASDLHCSPSLSLRPDKLYQSTRSQQWQTEQIYLI